VTSGGPEEPARADEARASRFGGRAGLVVTVAVGVVLAAGAFLLAREQATEPPELLRVGAEAPTFSLPAEDGATVAVPPASGEPTLVVFLETGCGSCREEAPVLAELARGGAQVVAVDVSGGSEADRARFAADDLEGQVPLAADDGRVGAAYRALVVPTVYAVRADGIIADAWAGRVDPGRFAQALATAGS
jgi:peroxiredoxin